MNVDQRSDEQVMRDMLVSTNNLLALRGGRQGPTTPALRLLKRHLEVQLGLWRCKRCDLPVKFDIQRCGPPPQYCDTCRPIVVREQTAARVRKHRTQS